MTQQRKEAFERAVAECVVASIPEVTLHEMRDAPDVDLLHDLGYHVGMEVVSTVDQRIPETRRRLVASTEAIRQALEEKRVLGTFRVCFDLAEMSPKVDVATRRAWDRHVPGRIAEFFASREGAGTFEESDLLSHGITGVASIERWMKDLTSVAYGFRFSAAALEGTLADIALANKHRKLVGYRARSNDSFRKFWLAIASFGPGTLEDGGFSMLLERRFTTDFDRVLLIEHASNGRFVRTHDVTPPGEVEA